MKVAVKFNIEMQKVLDAVKIGSKRGDKKLYEDFNSFNKLCESKHIHKLKNPSMQIKEHSMDVLETEDFDYCYEGKANLSSVSALIARLVYSQALMSIQGNYRQLDLDYIQKPQGILGNPFKPRGARGSHFDSAMKSPLWCTFYVPITRAMR